LANKTNKKALKLDNKKLREKYATTPRKLTQRTSSQLHQIGWYWNARRAVGYISTRLF